MSSEAEPARGPGAPGPQEAKMATITPPLTRIASGLRFPEGPVAMPDGSVILVEIARQTARST